MSIAEYLGGLSLAITLSVLIALATRTRTPLRLRWGIGVFFGFSAFLLGLMVMTAVGNIFVNSALAALGLSWIGRKSWRHP